MATDAYPADTIAAMAVWLVRRMDRVRQHEAAGEMVRQVTMAVRQAQRVIDRPPQRTYAGPCPRCGEDLLGPHGVLMIRCPGCGDTYDVSGRLTYWREQCADLLGSASWCTSMAIALGLRVNENTLRSWVRRHKLHVHHYEPPPKPEGEKKPIYRFGDVIELAIKLQPPADMISDGEVPASAANAPGTRPI